MTVPFFFGFNDIVSADRKGNVNNVFLCLCKGKVVPVLFCTEHHAMKTYWGSGGIAPPIL
jgi:hypothetical protein